MSSTTAIFVVAATLWFMHFVICTLNKKFNVAVGVSLIITCVYGFCLALYGSLYLGLFSGIVQVMENFQVDNVKFAWGVIRIIFFEMFAIPGLLMLWTAIVFSGIRR